MANSRSILRHAVPCRGIRRLRWNLLLVVLAAEKWRITRFLQHLCLTQGFPAFFTGGGRLGGVGCIRSDVLAIKGRRNCYLIYWPHSLVFVITDLCKYHMLTYSQIFSGVFVYIQMLFADINMWIWSFDWEAELLHDGVDTAVGNDWVSTATGIWQEWSGRVQNYGPPTTEFSCLISTHPWSPLHVLCILASWRCQEPNFNPLICLPSRTYSPGRPHVGLCPEFLVVVNKLILDKATAEAPSPGCFKNHLPEFPWCVLSMLEWSGIFSDDYSGHHFGIWLKEWKGDSG